MLPREPDEMHRAATPLELFFDLVFVVAVAQAASVLHHGVAGGHVVEAVVGYLLAFFGVWWAWVNFTWFASAYDVDDVPYRLAVLLQMTGALIFAAGVPALAHLDLRVGVTGYVIMRIALVFQWLRASAGDPERRGTALRYAGGVTLVQAGWVGLVAVPESWYLPGFVGLAALDLLVPAWAEHHARTPWHPEHIAERHGLFTIIVLGESVLAATLAIQTSLDGGETLRTLFPTIVGGLLILYSMWWFYFDWPNQELLSTPVLAFTWGYAHYLVLAAAAAVGAGLAAVTDVATHHADVGMRAAGLAVIVPVFVYTLLLWLLHRPWRNRRDPTRAVGPVAMVLLALAAFTSEPVLAAGVVMAGTVSVKVMLRGRVRTAG